MCTHLLSHSEQGFRETAADKLNQSLGFTQTTAYFCFGDMREAPKPTSLLFLTISSCSLHHLACTWSDRGGLLWSQNYRRTTGLLWVGIPNSLSGPYPAPCPGQRCSETWPGGNHVSSWSMGNPDLEERPVKGRWFLFLVNRLINTVGVYSHVIFYMKKSYSEEGSTELYTSLSVYFN